ncbi:MAG TPA: M23 family metallopeptidase [Leptolyngbyaceae cyanobacterium]
MQSRIPETYTVLIAGTGKAPIALTIQPIPLLMAALLLVSLPLAAIGYLTHHSMRLTQRNQDLTNTANQVLSELNTLDTDVEALKARAGMLEEAAEDEQGSDERDAQDSEDASIDRNSTDFRRREQSTSESDSNDEQPGDSQGGAANPVAAESLFEVAQKRIPTLALTLESDVRPALESTLAQEADREAAFPNGVPLKGTVEMSSQFGLRRNPFGGGNYEMHEGLDFKGPIGRGVYATADGAVVKVLTDKGYGKYIVIDHDYGYETLYAHLSEFKVEVGDKVERGDLIGYLGNTGRSSGPHLHYGIYRNGQPVNPRYYLKLEDSGL